MPDPSSKCAEAERLIHAGRLPDARAAVEKALRWAPNDQHANTLMCWLLMQTGKAREAVAYARKAVASGPRIANSHLNLGIALMECGQFAEAAAALRAGLAVDPHHLTLRAQCGNALHMDKRLTEAEAVLREGWEAAPDAASRHERMVSVLALVLQHQGRADEALKLMDGFLAEQPGNMEMLFAQASTMNYAAGTDPSRMLEAHRRYGVAVAGTVAATIAGLGPPPRPAPAAGAPLRVGFLSGDLRTHSVGFFAEPVVLGLDRSRFEVFCYSTLGSNPKDPLTARIKSGRVMWRDIPGLSTPDAVKRIRSDRIDILVELSGLTIGHRLDILAAGAAPVQLTYCGYPNTTGVPGIHGRIVDSLTDPVGPSPYRADDRCTERLIRLDPCFLCFRPPNHDIDTARASPSGEGHVVFGSFNAMQKIGPTTAALWRRVLDAVPGSRLLLKNTSLIDPRDRDGALARLTAWGLPADRLELVSATVGQREHLEAYRRVDIGLDPYPYHGTTTTCEALWMGVPVVSLVGATHASRVGLSLLTNVGLQDLAVPDEAAYIRAAASLAGDPTRLADLRRSLRARLLASPLCDAAGFAARFGQALERFALEMSPNP
ncbi:MAG: tetratricopeptide repeat protein [Phycisphaerales bacterium]|nr:tetratricopeptide repeat protein [Phycisphaerales bacterium]